LRLLTDIKILSPTETGKYAGIITFQKDSVDNVKLYQHLQDKNVICAYRGDGIRFSPHFYTGQPLMDKALEIVGDFVD
jgi:selenocysteine lyase/cysteine desulfurase